MINLQSLMGLNPIRPVYNPVRSPLDFNQTAPEDIVVQGGRDRAPTDPDLYEGMLLGNIDPLQERTQSNENSQKAVPRKGMFGIKGTLRDVLGGIGDAMLIQSGNQPMYAPRRRQEQISDAMAGFSRDPLAAAERVAQFDPALAQEMMDQYAQDQLRQAQLRSIDETRKFQNQGRDYDLLNDARNRAARLLKGAKTPNQRAYVLTLMDRDLQRYGKSIEDIGLSLGMTDDEFNVFVNSDMTVNQQEQLPFRERQLDISQQNADANTTRANRPPAPRAPRAETDSERFIRIGNTPEGQRSAGEREWYESKRSSSSGPRRPAGVSRPSRPGTSKPRIVGTRPAN